MARSIWKLGFAISLLSSILSARASTTASLTVTGAETRRADQSWDIGPLQISILQPNYAFVETIYYGQFSSPASVASQIAAAFARDYLQVGLCAYASGALVTFKLKSGQAFGPLTVTNPAASFQLQESNFSSYAWAPPGNSSSTYVTTVYMSGGTDQGTYYDSGTVSVRVSGAQASADWSDGSTASSVASELASAINSSAGGFVSASASGATVSVASLTGGPPADSTISGSVTDTNTTYFSSPSFSVSTVNMSGGAASEGSLLYGFNIPEQGGYDANGNLLSVADSVTGQWNYGYDSLNRLVSGSALTTSAQGIPNTFAGVQSSWTYDAFGNRTAENWTWAGSGTAPNMPTASTASYTTVSNQVSGTSLNGGSALQYDPAGNVTYDGLNSYLYDAEGRLCAVQNSIGVITGYIYNAAGSRVARGSLASFSCNFSPAVFQTTTSWVLGPGGEQVTEYAISNGTSTWVHTNAFADGKLLATYHDTDTYFALNDWLGTKRAETSAGGCFSSFTSMPFGNGLTPVSSSNPCQDATEHHFTGKERDAESGNDYFEARYYSSAMGRFMSPDWSAKEDPVPYANLENPQTLNLYSYVQNNPLLKPDLDGHGCPPDCSTGNDVVDFVNGLTNAWGSDNVLGAGRNNQSTSAGQLGQAFGDFGAAVQGAYETVVGAGGDIVGGGLDATGVGAIAGVPINVVSTAAVIHGTATGTEGATHLAMALAKPASGKGSVPKEQRAKPRTATEKERTEMRKEQGGNCAHCDKPLGDEPGISHHDPVRHSDGGTEQKLVHEACHQELHGKC